MSLIRITDLIDLNFLFKYIKCLNLFKNKLFIIFISLLNLKISKEFYLQRNCKSNKLSFTTF